MIIDCDRCEARNIACDDCVVSVLLAAPPAVEGGNIEWGEDESGALRALAQGGLVPPVRMRAERIEQPGAARREQPGAATG
jgi:hypothetical protein